jgi:hypothetical protein
MQCRICRNKDGISVVSWLYNEPHFSTACYECIAKNPTKLNPTDPEDSNRIRGYMLALTKKIKKWE